MAIDRHAKAREYVAADIRDAATHIEGALRLMSSTRWAPADRDRLATAIRVAYGAVGAARVLVDELTAATPEQDGGQAEGECTCSDLPDAPLCAACEHSMAAAVRGLGAPCTGCALVESSCRAHGGRCCDLCQHHTPEDPR